jgi:hypothetical protein
MTVLTVVMPKKNAAPPTAELAGGQTLDEDGHFAALVTRRQSRERVRTAFLEKAKRTSRPHRRWFRISEIEPDEAKRQDLIDLWRASIYSGDLLLRRKSQVLCLSESPLLENYRLPTELARGERFNDIVNDLWMSAPRWREWFRQVEKVPPEWLAKAGKKIWKPILGENLTKSELAILAPMNELWPDGPPGHKASERNRLINKWLKDHPTDHGQRPLESRTIQRALKKIRFA